jgi:hypothetical protein
MDESLQLYERTSGTNITHSEEYMTEIRYRSIQEKVNTDPAYETEYMRTLSSKGWRELNSNTDILRYPPGESFKYRLNGDGLSKAKHGTFRSGGFLIGPPDDSKDYILYKAYNGLIFPLQLKDVLIFYIKDVRLKTILFNKPMNITNNPVYLVDKNGNDVAVYYGKKPKDARKFTETLKFKTATKYGNWDFK